VRERAQGRIRGARPGAQIAAAGHPPGQANAADQVRTVQFFGVQLLLVRDRHRANCADRHAANQREPRHPDLDRAIRQPAQQPHPRPGGEAGDWRAIAAQQLCLDVVGDPLRVGVLLFGERDARRRQTCQRHSGASQKPSSCQPSVRHSSSYSLKYVT